MGWSNDLYVGLKADLVTRGVTKPLYYGAIPSEVDDAIGYIPYTGVDDPQLADVVQPIQLWLRGARGAGRAGIDATGDALFSAYHGVSMLTLGAVRVSLIERKSAVPMGTDSQDRAEAAHNYYFTAMRPTGSRPD